VIVFDVDQDIANAVDDDEKFNAMGVIARSAVLGFLIAFVITAAVTLIAGQNLLVAAGVALMPALFAGPFVAGLLVVISYHHYEESHPSHVPGDAPIV